MLSSPGELFPDFPWIRVSFQSLINSLSFLTSSSPHATVFQRPFFPKNPSKDILSVCVRPSRPFPRPFMLWSLLLRLLLLSLCVCVCVCVCVCLCVCVFVFTWVCFGLRARVFLFAWVWECECVSTCSFMVLFQDHFQDHFQDFQGILSH